MISLTDILQPSPVPHFKRSMYVCSTYLILKIDSTTFKFHIYYCIKQPKLLKYFIIFSLLYSKVICSLWNKHKIPHLCPKFLWYHSLFLFTLLNPNWSSPRISCFLPNLLLSILATFFAVFVSKLSVRWSLHFVAFGFIFFFSRGGHEYNTKMK